MASKKNKNKKERVKRKKKSINEQLMILYPKRRAARKQKNYRLKSSYDDEIRKLKYELLSL
jgi:hypothetical protein